MNGARADVIVVKQGESAVAALSRAESGDTIHLQPGVFQGDLVIERPGLTLEGEPGAVVEGVTRSR
jgi:nitrous oxidase accessory protein